jgi:hypothetical protein
MKKVLVIVVTLCAVCGTASAQQNLGGLLKGVATQIVDKATDGKATEYLLTDTWEYSDPAVRFESENTLANLAATSLASTFETKLQNAYNLVGMKKGEFSLTLNTDNTFSMVTGKRTYKGTYTYNAETHALELKFDTTLIKLRSLSGYAYLDGDNLDVAFDCTKLVNFLTAVGSKVSSLKSITDAIGSYENVLVGFTYTRG